MDYTGKNIVVLGMGETGLSAARWLHARGRAVHTPHDGAMQVVGVKHDITADIASGPEPGLPEGVQLHEGVDGWRLVFRRSAAQVMAVLAALGMLSTAALAQAPAGETKGTGLVHTPESGRKAIDNAQIGLPGRVTSGAPYLGPLAQAPRTTSAVRAPVVVFNAPFNHGILERAFELDDQDFFVECSIEFKHSG